MTTKKKAVKPQKLSKKVVKAVARKLKPKKPADPFKGAKTYIGIKQIDAVPMSLGDYNKHRSWIIPEKENPNALGYMVRYQDGYVSWSPKAQFEEAYQENGKLSFGTAVLLMKQGFKLARSGWNGKGMWVIYVPGTKKAEMKAGTPYANHLPKRKTVEILPHFDMWTVNSQGRRAMLPGWLASQSDLDSNDWMIVK